MPTDASPPTLAEAVHTAVAAAETGPPDAGLDDLLLAFEDADEPLQAVEDVEQLLDEALGRIDSDWETSGALSMARAVAVYLSFRRDEAGADTSELLRLAARAEFDGSPPPAVARWLAEAGVEV